MRISFFVGGRPAPQQRPRYVKDKGILYSPKSDFYRAVVAYGRRYAPLVPIDKAVKLTVKFCYKAPQCKEHAIYNTSRPDLDNLEKTVMDALTEAKIWRDDSLVVVKLSGKVYRLSEGVEIMVETLKNIRNFGEEL